MPSLNNVVEVDGAGFDYFGGSTRWRNGIEGERGKSVVENRSMD